MIRKSDFNYNLPERLIAQHPLDRRDQSRLLVLDKNGGRLEHRIFQELPRLLSPGDCLVLNNTRVIPARLRGVRQDSRAPVELLLLRRHGEHEWETAVHPGRKVKPGDLIELLPGALAAEVTKILPTGNRMVRFHYQGAWEDILARTGLTPLPPYIHEKLRDPDRYQTVYAKFDGSAAAPTAGLHFTPELLRELRIRGVRIAELTLHVGLGTFRPVRTENILDHHMHAEYYELPQEAVDKILQSKAEGGRIIAVGTTSCRVLEAVAAEFGQIEAHSGWTDIFIYPGFSFRVIDGLVTNFHLPESTLIMLVSALAGRENILAAYEVAIRQEYRFFSFGDAMLIWDGVRPVGS